MASITSLNGALKIILKTIEKNVVIQFHRSPQFFVFKYKLDMELITNKVPSVKILGSFISQIYEYV